MSEQQEARGPRPQPPQIGNGQSPACESAIEACDLTKRFGAVTALEGLNLSVREGDVFALVGPNGAGKSTLISILCTLLRATSGHARVRGTDVAQSPASVRRQIGLVFQESTLDRQLTARENLRFHAVMYGVPSTQRSERIESALSMLQLADRADDVVATFSGGMARRLEVARALVHLPSVLFLDEPTLGLDPQTRARMWRDVIGTCRARGVTVFFTTHYLEEAELADSIGFLSHGRLIRQGTPAQLCQSIGGERVDVEVRDGPGAVAALRAAGFTQAYSPEAVRVTQQADSVLKGRAGALPVSPGASRDARIVCVPVSDAASAVASIVRVLGAQVTRVSVHVPSLDDVYLHFVGEGLDQAPPAAVTHAHLEKGAQYK
ncbi:MAG: ATP-binding cassette domain-containing protein [Actinobacteria bacterium]|nr:ATP-binding cassette domain-containing protein [Actinomycetota bacterium]